MNKEELCNQFDEVGALLSMWNKTDCKVTEKALAKAAQELLLNVASMLDEHEKAPLGLPDTFRETAIAPQLDFNQIEAANDELSLSSNSRMRPVYPAKRGHKSIVSGVPLPFTYVTLAGKSDVIRTRYVADGKEKTMQVNIDDFSTIAKAVECLRQKYEAMFLCYGGDA